MKSPSERGQVGAWAYEARADADLSVEEVVERLTRAGQPVSAATVRGIEGGSKRPSRRLLRALATVYGRPAPGEHTAGAGSDTTQPVPAAYLERIDSLVAQLTAERAQTAELIGLLRSVLPAIQPGAAPEDQRLVEEAEGQYAEGAGLPGDTPSQRRSLAHTPDAETPPAGHLIGAASRGVRR